MPQVTWCGVLVVARELESIAPVVSISPLPPLGIKERGSLKSTFPLGKVEFPGFENGVQSVWEFTTFLAGQIAFSWKWMIFECEFPIGLNAVFVTWEISFSQVKIDFPGFENGDQSVWEFTTFLAG